MRTDGQVDEEEYVELDERGEDEEGGVDAGAGHADAPVQLKAVQRQGAVQRE